MTEHRMKVKRAGISGFFSKNSIGTDAFNAISSIPGTSNVEVVHETEDRAEVSYHWDGREKFWRAGEVLNKHGLDFDEE